MRVHFSPTEPTGGVTRQNSASNRELIAEGLNAAQLKQLLIGLKTSGRINGIGTPSREEVVNPRPDRKSVV